ncbi:MAG: lipoate--protein ligase [Spirochaetia bacterium]|nr:lipoate--protein ligase [Spirochaetia bacterium]
MNKIYISQETDPYYNVALEHQLLLEANDDTLLFLWQNSSSVIFGRNQNLFAEVDTQYLKENNISPVRRFSGGGAVFQDLGNLNFTFITKEKNIENDKYLKVIIKALNSLNINCEFSGRNDILTNGKKFSGHAYYTSDDNYLYHGTIMVDVNLDMLTKVLKPSFLKLNSKAIDSVRSRVVNLSQINNKITTQKIEKALINSFIEIFEKSEPLKFVNKDNYYAPLFKEINKDNWIYGESPEFSITIEKKFSFGNVALSTNIENGRIKKIKIQTDSLIVADFKACEEELKRMLFQEENIFNYVEKYMKVNYLTK